jgi:hypothetical protein
MNLQPLYFPSSSRKERISSSGRTLTKSSGPISCSSGFALAGALKDPEERIVPTFRAVLHILFNRVHVASLEGNRAIPANISALENSCAVTQQPLQIVMHRFVPLRVDIPGIRTPSAVNHGEIAADELVPIIAYQATGILVYIDDVAFKIVDIDRVVEFSTMVRYRASLSVSNSSPRLRAVMSRMMAHMPLGLPAASRSRIVRSSTGKMVP